MTNADLDNLLNEYFTLKNELANCTKRYNDKRIDIYNKLVNLNKIKYSNSIATVSKTEDRNYLTVTKETFFNAIHNVNLSPTQRATIMDKVFKEIPVSGSIFIKKK